MRITLAVSALLVALPLAASAMDMTGGANTVKWGPGPASFPPGARFAVISGDPGKDGPYVVRAKMPSGYTVPPHTHPADENVTVISGTLNIAMGDKLDKKKGDAIKAGGFFRAEKGMQHYAWASGATIIQVHGMGPFAITYVNPADDPRNKTAAQAQPKK